MASSSSSAKSDKAQGGKAKPIDMPLVVVTEELYNLCKNNEDVSDKLAQLSKILKSSERKKRSIKPRSGDSDVPLLSFPIVMGIDKSIAKAGPTDIWREMMTVLDPERHSMETVMLYKRASKAHGTACPVPLILLHSPDHYERRPSEDENALASLISDTDEGAEKMTQMRADGTPFGSFPAKPPGYGEAITAAGPSSHTGVTDFVLEIDHLAYSADAAARFLRILREANAGNRDAITKNCRQMELMVAKACRAAVMRIEGFGMPEIAGENLVVRVDGGPIIATNPMLVPMWLTTFSIRAFSVTMKTKSFLKGAAMIAREYARMPLEESSKFFRFAKVEPRDGVALQEEKILRGWAASPKLTMLTLRRMELGLNLCCQRIAPGSQKWPVIDYTSEGAAALAPILSSKALLEAEFGIFKESQSSPPAGAVADKGKGKAKCKKISKASSSSAAPATKKRKSRPSKTAESQSQELQVLTTAQRAPKKHASAALPPAEINDETFAVLVRRFEESIQPRFDRLESRLDAAIQAIQQRCPDATKVREESQWIVDMHKRAFQDFRDEDRRTVETMITMSRAPISAVAASGTATDDEEEEEEEYEEDEEEDDDDDDVEVVRRARPRRSASAAVDDSDDDESDGGKGKGKEIVYSSDDFEVDTDDDESDDEYSDDVVEEEESEEEEELSQMDVEAYKAFLKNTKPGSAALACQAPKDALVVDWSRIRCLASVDDDEEYLSESDSRATTARDRIRDNKSIRRIKHCALGADYCLTLALKDIDDDEMPSLSLTGKFGYVIPYKYKAFKGDPINAKRAAVIRTHMVDGRIPRAKVVRDLKAAAAKGVFDPVFLGKTPDPELGMCALCRSMSRKSVEDIQALIVKSKTTIVWEKDDIKQFLAKATFLMRSFPEPLANDFFRVADEWCMNCNGGFVREDGPERPDVIRIGPDMQKMEASVARAMRHHLPKTEVFLKLPTGVPERDGNPLFCCAECKSEFAERTRKLTKSIK